MQFKQQGLPEWVVSTRGLSGRDDSGRWTDRDLAAVPGIIFARNFSGPLCVDLVARPAKWLVGKEFTIRMGNESKTLRLAPENTDYQVQFNNLERADELDLLFPYHLPAVAEMDLSSSDPRRLGISLSSLRLNEGTCATGAGLANVSR
jgi:hypothetical protein